MPDDNPEFEVIASFRNHRVAQSEYSTAEDFVEACLTGKRSNAFAIFSQGENPAVYGGRESDTC